MERICKSRLHSCYDASRSSERLWNRVRGCVFEPQSLGLSGQMMVINFSTRLETVFMYNFYISFMSRLQSLFSFLYEGLLKSFWPETRDWMIMQKVWGLFSVFLFQVWKYWEVLSMKMDDDTFMQASSAASVSRIYPRRSTRTHRVRVFFPTERWKSLNSNMAERDDGTKVNVQKEMITQLISISRMLEMFKKKSL